MKRYEYKVVPLRGSTWWGGTSARQEALLEMLNREGRAGWRLVVTHQPGPVPWSSVLLERAVD